jgi:hypothetical protein
MYTHGLACRPKSCPNKNEHRRTKAMSPGQFALPSALVCILCKILMLFLFLTIPSVCTLLSRAQKTETYVKKYWYFIVQWDRQWLRNFFFTAIKCFVTGNNIFFFLRKATPPIITLRAWESAICFTKFCCFPERNYSEEWAALVFAVQFHDV